MLSSKSLAAKSLWAVFIRGAAALSTIIASLVVTNTLGAEQSGLYFIGFAFVTVLATISRVGLDNTVLKLVGAASAVGDSGRISSILGKALATIFVTGALLGGGVWLFSEELSASLFNKPDMDPVLSIMSLLTVSLSVCSIFSMVLQGMHRIVGSLMVLSIVSNFGLVALLLVIGASSAQMVGVFFAVASFGAVIVGALLLKPLLYYRRDEGADWLEIYAVSKPLFIVSLCTLAVQWSGQLVGGVVLNPQELAYVAVSQRVAMLLSFVLIAVNFILAPKLAGLYGNGDSEAAGVLAVRATRLMVLVSAPLAIAMLIFPELFLQLFGAEFVEARHVLQILAVGQLVNVVVGPVNYLLIMSGHELELRNNMIVSAALAVVLSLSLIPLWGALGAAVATSLAVGVQNLLSARSVKRKLKVSIFSASM